jgi:hypothetical protein
MNTVVGGTVGGLRNVTLHQKTLLQLRWGRNRTAAPPASATVARCLPRRRHKL